MANELTDAGELLLLDLVNGVSAVAPVTTPLKLALLTVQGTDATAGTEVTGGSYVRQTITMGAAAAGSSSNSNALSFTGMPACTVVGFAVYDSTATPKRLWEVPRTGGSAVVNAGDTFNVAVGGIVLSMN